MAMQGTQVPLLPTSALSTHPAASLANLLPYQALVHLSCLPRGAPKGPVSRGLASPGVCRSQWVGNGAHCPATALVRPGSVREAGESSPTRVVRSMASEKPAS